MKITPIFSIGIGQTEIPEALTLAKTIFEENQHIILDGSRTRTNFIAQTAQKHIINEDYKDKKKVESLKLLLHRFCIEYLKKVGYHTDGYKYEIINLWFNEYRTGDRQFSHCHQGYLVSGSYFVDIPEDSSPIVFHSPIPLIYTAQYLSDEKRTFDVYNSHYWTMYPKAGELMVWNSNLYHEVTVNQSKEIRRTVSFDLGVKGFEGDTKDF